MTATSQDVLLALLSLDAYSRGSFQQLLTQENTELSKIIGTAEVNIVSSSRIPDAALVGFSAASYNIGSGENATTVIAFRGTDFYTENLSFLETVNDVVGGWFSSAGVFGTSELGQKLQPGYALEFYKLVTGRDAFPDGGAGSPSSPSGNVIITGHSLGGSLAGFVGSLSGDETVIFNEIPYLGLALTASITTFLDEIKDLADPAVVYEKLIGFLNGNGLLVPGFTVPDGTEITSFRTYGEIAGLARLLGPFMGFMAQQLLPTNNVVSEALAAAALVYGNTADAQQEVIPIDSFGGLIRSPVALHSQALMVLLTYADSKQLVDWHSVGPDLLDALFSNDVGLAVGTNTLNGYATNAAKLMDIIAYSVIEEGGLVFGNTAAKALFNDANALGLLTNNDLASHALQNAMPGLLEAVVQFAGLMALREVDYRNYGDDDYSPEDGVILLSDADGQVVDEASEATLLTIDINQGLWQLGQDDTVTFIEILGVKTLLDSLFERTANTVGDTLVSKAIHELYAGTENAPVQQAISAAQFSLSEQPLVLQLAETQNWYDPHHATLFVATDADDLIDGNSQNNIIAGSDGDDVFNGHLGRDILIGGGGNDLFIDSVTEVDDETGRQNEDDIYVGGDQKVGLVTDFIEWLISGTETDTVRYTVDADAKAGHPDDLGDISDFTDGVRVKDIEVTQLGAADAIKLTVQDQNGGKSGTDILVSIDKVELSDRADELILTDAALKAAILIDMGKSGRIESELPVGETLSPNAFVVNVDVADYSGISHGLNYLNGVTSPHSQVGEAGGIFQFGGLDQELLTISDYFASGLLGYNDALHVSGADLIRLTDFDDVVISAAYGAIIETGAGNDKIWFTDGIAISDLDMNDRIVLGGVITLYGGLKNEASEDPFAWGAYGTAYGTNDEGELVIRNAYWHTSAANADGDADVATVYVLNWKNSVKPGPNGQGEVGPGGIFLAEVHASTILFRDITLDMKGTYSALGEGAYDLLNLRIKILTGTPMWGGQDPLVLDLDGDGIELTALDYSKARIDIDNDLYAETSGFVGKDDGILVRDIDGDGKITSSAEMFGQGTTSGFSFLALLDGNLDGKVDAADAGLVDFDADGDVDGNDTFEKLLVWQDGNENHVVDAGELKTVVERGIISISVAATPLAQPLNINGNTVTSTASYTLSDGTVRTIGDVLLRLENQNTEYVGPAIIVSQSVADLADIKGHGTLVSLHEALSVAPAGESTVRNAVMNLTSPNLADLRESIKPILGAWALGSPVKINGQIVTGEASITPYDDLAIIRKNGVIVDYAWGFGQEAGTSSGPSGIRMASGVVVSTNAVMNGRGDLGALITSWTGSVPNVVVTTGMEVQADGTSLSYLDYSAGSDFLRIYNYQLASWSSSLGTSASHSLETDVFIEVVGGTDLSFYERVIGESLTPFFANPDSASAGLAAVTAFLEKMDDVLNVFAVRLAVQSGPISEYFQSIDYNIASDNFTSKSGTQIAEVFKGLLHDAEQTANAQSWLTEWKPFFDVFLSDYSRGSASQKNSYAFLVQNMMAAVEHEAGGMTVTQFADAFGLPEGLVVEGEGLITGTSDDDIIIVDGNDTAVMGGSGSDNYVVGRAFQSVEILDNDGFSNSIDSLRFSAHKSSEIVASRDGIDLLLTDPTSGETIRIVNQFEGRWPGATIGDASFEYGISQIVFADGSVWTKVDIAEAVSKIDPVSTHIIGTADIDILQGGAGDDILEGAGDTDIYRYESGDGRDTIIDYEDNSFRNDQDMLQFLGGILTGDLVFVHEGDSKDLIIRFKGNASDQITITGQFGATYTGVYGIWYQNRIDLFTFDNGSSLTHDQVANIVLHTYSTDGTDALYGFDREDVLRAGKGDDFISGGNQNDLYLYSLGDGHDVIQDENTNFLSGTDDILRFDTGISWTDMTFARVEDNYNSVVLHINGGAGSIELRNEFAYASTGVFGNVFFDRIETLQFTDGNIAIDSFQLAAVVLASEKTLGNDIINGFDIDDVLDGGAGDDTLYGNNGDDTYVWGRASGNDRIQERGYGALSGGDYDKIVFSDYVTSEDISLARDASTQDLTITIVDTGETLTLINQFSYNAINYRPDQVDEVHFSDGKVWYYWQLRQQYLLAAKTAGADTIVGFHTDDVLDGGAGDDLLLGGDGSDTYVFGHGYGNDEIRDDWSIVTYSDDDQVVFTDVAMGEIEVQRIGVYDLLIMLVGSTDTLLVKNAFYRGVFDQNDIENYVFTDGTLTKEQLQAAIVNQAQTAGNDIILGFDFNNTITGGLGDDNMNGAGWNDTYVYARGDGNDVITEDIYSGTNDILQFTDINSSELFLKRIGEDMLVTFESGDGGFASILLRYSVNDYAEAGIEQMIFADGTTWSRADWRVVLLQQPWTAGDDVINGLSTSDTYVYSSGGNDRIVEGIYNGTNDRLLFTSHALANLHFDREGVDLKITVYDPSGAIEGSVTLADSLNDYADAGIEEIVLSDGTLLARNDWRAILLQQSSTSGDDIINGFSTPDAIHGGLGDDLLNAGGSNDRYVYYRGDGNDIITETIYNGTADRLVLADLNLADVSFSKNGVDLIITIAQLSGNSQSVLVLKDSINDYAEAGIEEVLFADGSLWTRADWLPVVNGTIGVEGTPGNDTITGAPTDERIDGGAGNDMLSGNGGSDTFVYRRGDGHDTIIEISNNGTSDRLLFLDINPSDVSVIRETNSIKILVLETSVGSGNAGSLLLKDILTQAGIEIVEFADGTIWGKSDLIDFLVSPAGSVGNDTIIGTSGADILSGGLGSDTLSGGEGDDTYIYSRGDGHDTINEGAIEGVGDKLVFNDINASDVTFVRVGNDLRIDVAASAPGPSDAGSILLKDSLNDFFRQGVDSVVFADGTTLTKQQIGALILQQTATSGNDTITGFIINDTIAGGQGNDTLSGGAGDDTYIYSRGDGHDTINEGAIEGVGDKLVFTDINASAVTFVRVGNDLRIDVAASAPGASDAGSILLKDSLNDFFRQGVDSVVFADGTTLTKQQIGALILQQTATSGNDTITGFIINDTIAGGQGNDTLSGGAGDDTYIYSRGDGHDTINEGAIEGVGDKLVFNDINASAVTFVRVGNDLRIDVAASAPGASDAGSILLKDSLNDFFRQGVDSVIFADGITLTKQQIGALILQQTATSGNDTITGFVIDDTIAGGQGDDMLNGGQGNDTYVYSQGDGTDTITDSVNSGANDRLRFTDLNKTDVTLTRNGNDVTVVIRDNGDPQDSGSITLKESLSGYYSTGVETIIFADGTSWSRTDMLGELNATANYAASGGPVSVDLTSGTAIVETPPMIGQFVRIYQTNGYHLSLAEVQVFEDGQNVALAGTATQKTTGYGGVATRAIDGNTDGNFNNGSVTHTGTANVGEWWQVDLGRSVTIGEIVLFNRTDSDSGRLSNFDIVVTQQALSATASLQDAISQSGAQVVHYTGAVPASDTVFSGGSTTEILQGIKYVVGSDFDDIILGDAANNSLLGGHGDDLLEGRGGNDIYSGDDGDDSFVFKANFGHDTITDFAAGAGTGDVLEFSSDLFVDFEDVLAAAAQVGGDTVITHDNANTILLKNVAMSTLHHDDFRFVA